MASPQLARRLRGRLAPLAVLPLGLLACGPTIWTTTQGAERQIEAAVADLRAYFDAQDCYPWRRGREHCLAYDIEAVDSMGVEIGVRERHTRRCGGHPEVAPLVGRFRVEAGGEVRCWDSDTGSFGACAGCEFLLEGPSASVGGGAAFTADARRRDRPAGSWVLRTGSRSLRSAGELDRTSRSRCSRPRG